jgi:hypothetical protein
MYRQTAAPVLPSRVEVFGSPLWSRIRLGSSVAATGGLAVAVLATSTPAVGALAVPLLLGCAALLRDGAFGSLEYRPSESLFVVRPFGYFSRTLRLPKDEVLEAVVVTTPRVRRNDPIAHTVVLRTRSGNNPPLFRHRSIEKSTAVAHRAEALLRFAREEPVMAGT